MKPTALLATTCRWFPTARLAMALAKVGFNVKALCPSGHPIEKTGATKETFTYRGVTPLASFNAAISAAQPDIIVPCDDLATRHLHDIYHRREGKGKTSKRICDLIEESLGHSKSFAVAYARAKSIELAREEGIRAPDTEAIQDIQALHKWIAVHDLPVVLKVDGSSGGVGVRICHTAEEAERAFRLLSRPPSWVRAAKRLVVDRDATLLLPTFHRRRPLVNAQTFIRGNDATSIAACWKGTVLASLHFEVLARVQSNGHASVLRIVENPELSAAVETMVRKLKLSGLCGFDFVREVETRHSFLIELNPRTTQVGHLALGPGRDLATALFSAVTGKSVDARPPVTEKDTIALFPQEWVRDSDSPWLRSAYHDVPWEAPDLVMACANGHRRWKSRYMPKRAVGNPLELKPDISDFLRESSPADWIKNQTKTRFPRWS